MDREQAYKLLTALQRANRYFQNRDKMNAEVHCQAPRLSPITELVAEAESIAEGYCSELDNS